MPISPTGSARIPAPQRRFWTPSHCGRSGESTNLCALPTAPSPMPSRQVMLRRYAAFLGLFRRNPEAVATYSQALADTATRYDFPAYWAGIAVFLQGWAKSRLAEMRHGLAIYREQGRIWLLPEAVLAEAEASAGEIDAGLRRLDDTLAELERTEERLYEAEMHRIRGEILLKRDPADTTAAERSLRAAIAVAQSQKARSFE